MARSRKSQRPQGVAATTTQAVPSFDDNFDDNENSNEDNNAEPVAQNNEDIPVNTNEATRLKANVWQYAKKVTNEKAQCIRCKLHIKTVRGGTTTLRKHLITKHNLIHLTTYEGPRTTTNNLISQEQKHRLDYLANVAIFQDGRTFGDLRKHGIRKFLAEEIPDEDSEDDDDDEDNLDLITDEWQNGVITGDMVNMDVDGNDNDNDNNEHIIITKQKLSKTIQKSRSLIKTLRRSQILTALINNEKPMFKITHRLIADCMSRWNSTFFSLQTLVEHKPILANLFENKRKLPITSKQKEKLTSVELSSDDWIILNNLIEIFKPFYLATNHLSGSTYPTIGLCLFTLRKIKHFLETNDNGEPDILINLKDLVLESFNSYFDENDEQFSLLMLYGYFDPIGYHILTPKERSKVERDIKQKHKEQNKSQTTTTTSSISTTSSSSSSILASTTNSTSFTNMKYNKKTNWLTLFLKSVNDEIISDKFDPKTISEEIALYGSLCKKNKSEDAITFWQLHGQQMPMLKVVAQKYLSTSGTSVPSESAFSCSAYIGRKERARLSPENLSYTVFLKDKLESS